MSNDEDDAAVAALHAEAEALGLELEVRYDDAWGARVQGGVPSQWDSWTGSLFRNGKRVRFEIRNTRRAAAEAVLATERRGDDPQAEGSHAALAIGIAFAGVSLVIAVWVAWVRL